MALRDQPYLPLYIQDYLTDEKLNMCSWQTQGIYIKILCILHKQKKYGSILYKPKSKQTESIIKNFALILVRQIPCQMNDMENALNELIDNEVLMIENNELYQKRMLKDGETSIARSIAGKKGGGNPNLHKQKYKQTPKQKYKQIPEDEYEDEYENEYEDESEDESNNENVNENVKVKKIVKETNIVQTKNYTELYKIAKDFLDYQRTQFGKAVNNSPDNIQKSIPILSDLIRLDGFSIPEIIGTLNFASNDDFWAINVQSILQLRKKKKNEDQTKFQKLYSRAGKWLKSEIKKSQDKEKQDRLQKAFGK